MRTAREGADLTVDVGIVLAILAVAMVLFVTEWVRMDIRYLASRTFLRDLKLILKTLPAVFSGRGAN